MPRAVPRRLEDAPSNTAREDALGADFDPASRGASHDARRDEAIDPETAADAVLHAQRRALLEARAILADAEQNARDEDLLLAEEVAHEHPEEAAKRAFAAGALKDDLATKSAWCVEPLRPTEEDVMKQRVYERVRKPKFRRRHAVHLYGDPDAFESLRLDAETEMTDTEKQRRFLYGEERRRKPRTVDDDDDDDDDATTTRNKVGGILSAVFGPGAGDPDGVPGVSVVPPSDSSDPNVKATRTATTLPGNTSRATATKSSATASVPTDAFRTKRAEVAALAAISADLERVPPHLRGRILPAELDIPEGARVVKIAGGDAHCAILLDTSRLIERVLPRHREHAGRVLMLGSHARGQLGLGDSFDRSIPATLTTLTDRTHYLAGRGGGGRVADHAAGDSLGGFSKPGGVRGVQDVAAGAAHTVLVTEDARAAAFGQDARGCLGQGESGLNRRFLLPRVMHWVSRSCTKVVRCAAGASHTALLTADGRVLTLGDGANGRLGHGEDAPGGGFRSSSVPRRVAGLDGLRVVGVSCGRRHTLCVTESGLAYVWGANEAGQLGQGDRRDRASPARVRHEEGTATPTPTPTPTRTRTRTPVIGTSITAVVLAFSSSRSVCSARCGARTRGSSHTARPTARSRSPRRCSWRRRRCAARRGWEYGARRRRRARRRAASRAAWRRRGRRSTPSSPRSAGTRTPRCSPPWGACTRSARTTAGSSGARARRRRLP